MAVKLSPVYLDAQFINGIPAVGAQLFTYAAGSTTKQVTYQDSAGTVPNSNPIILNARGEPPAIWLNAGQTYKFVLASSTDTDPPTSPIRVIDNISGVNDTSINIDEWVNSNLTPTYLSSTQFSVLGDQTSAFQINRRIKLLVSAGTVYGYISNVSYTSLTTVTVSLDSGALDTGLSQVSLALLGASNPSVPSLIDTIFRVVKSSALSIFFRFDLSGLTASRTITIPDKSGTLAMTSDLVAVVNATNDPTFASTSSTNPASPEWVVGWISHITFVDKTSSRSPGTTYTNSTNRIRHVNVHGTITGGNAYIQATLTPPVGSALSWKGSNNAGATGTSNIYFPVLPGWTYSVTPSTGSLSITANSWLESEAA